LPPIIVTGANASPSHQQQHAQQVQQRKLSIKLRRSYLEPVTVQTLTGVEYMQLRNSNPLL
jgi:hypothetical protein